MSSQPAHGLQKLYVQIEIAADSSLYVNKHFIQGNALFVSHRILPACVPV
jgi:hypothetical protein